MVTDRNVTPYTHYVATVTKTGRGKLHAVEGWWRHGTIRPTLSTVCGIRPATVTAVYGSDDELLRAGTVADYLRNVASIGSSACRECYNMLTSEVLS